GRLRCDRVQVTGDTRRVPLPNISAGEELLRVFLGRVDGKSIVADSLREITEMRDGAVWLPAEAEGPREVLFFISSRTGMMVKRPALGAEGFVMDHYDRDSNNDYLGHVGDRLMPAFGGKAPYALFCD